MMSEDSGTQPGAAQAPGGAAQSPGGAAPKQVETTSHSDTRDGPSHFEIGMPSKPIPVKDVATDTTVKAALIFICFVVGAWSLSITSSLVAPFALAVFFWLIIDAFAKWIDRLFLKGAPFAIALTVAISVIVAALAGLIYVVTDTATNIADDSEVYTRRLTELSVMIGDMIGVDLSGAALRDILNIGDLVRGSLGGFAVAIQSVVSDTFIITVYVVFLFVAQRSFPKKLDDMVPDPDARARTASTFERIRHSIETYLSVQTLISLIQTVLSYAIMLAFGLENALFWALVIFILNYIPIVGAIGAALLPGLFALVQFDTLTPVLSLTALLLVVQSLIANTLQPKMMGDSMNLSALVVVIALVVWGALWGGVGAFLSAPLTVIIMVILAQFPTTRWLAVMLSADGQPDLDPYQKRRNQAVPSM